MNDTCTVRPAGDGDLAGVLGVHARRDDAAGTPAPPTARERATWDRIVATPDLTVYLAERGGEAVGTASALLMPNLGYDCAPSLFVEAVVVAAGHRRRGIATALLRRALADAADAGADKVQVVSHKRHAADGAHALYLGLGFTAEAEGFRLYLGGLRGPG
jgi:GNAT superfamily N-acetyltransferase